MSFTKKVLGLLFIGMLLVVGGVAKAESVSDLQAQITALMAQIKVLQTRMAAIPAPSEVWCHTFEKNLRVGDINAEISALHEALSKDGFGALLEADKVKSEFSDGTASAVTGFQQKYSNEILTPAGLKYGTGFVGAGTRAKLNKLYGCGDSMPPIGCTMDAKQCPDGTYVSRTGPKCEFTSCPIYKSLTVASPNGGETWVKGTTQTIKWQDISVASTCPAGVDCPQSVPGSYDISLVKYQPCTESTCSTQVARIIAKGVYGRSYSWSVGARVPAEYSDEEVITPDGSYAIQVCRSGADICDSSDSYFKIISSSATKSVTVVSPNGGETLVKGRESLIKWQDNATVSTCPVGVDCARPAPKTYDIKLAAYATPCTGNICPMSMIRLPYTIAKNVSGNSYNWEAGRVWDDSQYVADGAYLIQVCFAGSDACDSSDSYFKITSGSSVGLPTISGVSGPTTLTVGQQGTWTVKASDSNNGNLYYSVVWGDESNAMCASGAACVTTSAQYQQTAIFTHAYNNAGYYSPKFTVTNANGGSAVTTISVNVGETTIPTPSDTIQVMYPQTKIELLRGSVANLYWIQSNIGKNVDLRLIPTGGITSSASYNIISGLTPKMNKEQTYSWSVGNIISAATRITLIPDGEYYFKVCYTGTDVCGSSKYTLKITTPGAMLPQTSAVTNNTAQTASLLESMKATLEKIRQSLR